MMQWVTIFQRLIALQSRVIRWLFVQRRQYRRQGMVHTKLLRRRSR